MNAVYSTVEEESAALEDGAGLADLSAAGKVLFDGPDRNKFLNGLLTNDVAKLEPLRGFACCILTPKGKLRADFLLYDIGGELLALGLPGAIHNLAESVAKVIILGQTRMEDAAGRFGLFYIAGPKARAALAAAFGKFPELEPYQVLAVKRKGLEARILSAPCLRPDGHLLLMTSESAPAVWALLLEAGRRSGLKPVGAAALEASRIERGLPLFGVDMDEETLPQEARLESAISFTKGCYMGQETVSRIRHLGHVNKLLAVLRLEGTELPAPGAAVFMDGREVGRVTSAAWSPRARAVLALGMLGAAESRTGAKLRVGDAAGREAEVVAFTEPAGAAST